MQSPATALRELIIDAYSALTHKALVAESNRYQVMLPAYLSPDQQRRLAAYRTLAAYLENVARHLLREHDPGHDAGDYREYGDPGLFVSRIVSGVLGDSMSLAVDGADDELAEMPDLPPRPEEPDADADDIEGRIHEIRLARWEAEAGRIVDEWAEAVTTQPALQARQDWLREWADRELLEQKVWECETDAVGLGDGVYVLGVSNDAERVRLRVYPPDVYFPVLDDNAEARGYPERIHLCWEYVERDALGREETFVRRVTYELGPIAGLDEDGEPTTGTRVMPWGEVTAETCYLTDAVWRKPDIRGGVGPDDFTTGAATYQQNEEGEVLDRLDLGFNFIPVVHVPNTPADKEHFGRSSIARVLQLLDDVATTDTDLQAAASLAGTPMAAMSGDRAPDQIEVKPGLIIGVGPDGGLDVIDMSASVTALQGVVESLLDRLSVNGQVPAGLLGRVDPGEVSSGVQLALSFSPFTQLVGVLRLVREHKYRLLLRFVQRMSQVAGFLEPGDTPPTRLVFGSFLPEDQAAVVKLVTQLLTEKAISRRTALVMLREVGLPIDDVAGELAAIGETDFEGAQQLFEALGADEPVWEYLGREDLERLERPEPEPPRGPLLDGRGNPIPENLPTR